MPETRVLRDVAAGFPGSYVEGDRVVWRCPSNGTRGHRDHTGSWVSPGTVEEGLANLRILRRAHESSHFPGEQR